MNTRSALLVGFLVLSACSSTPEAIEPAAMTSADPVAPQVTAAASAEPTPPPATSAPAPAATGAPASAATSGPKSRYTIGGQSLTDVDFATLQAEVKKAGYELQGPGEPAICGDNENLQVGVGKKGKPLGSLSLSRRAKSPKAGCSPSSNKDSLATWKKGIDDPKGTSALPLRRRGRRAAGRQPDAREQGRREEAARGGGKEALTRRSTTRGARR